jgi:uncharacterized protein (DUF488 family)
MNGRGPVPAARMRDVAERAPVFTIGHSTHAVEHLIALLERHRVELVADVRRFPGSRRHPQFGAEALSRSLDEAGIGYLSLGELGGRRRARPDSANAGWRSGQFRGYADHTASAEFARGLARLEAAATSRRAAIMCAEADWRRCHRQLIADALVARGWRVFHIGRDGRVERHELTSFAVVEDETVRYPGQGTLLG